MDKDESYYENLDKRTKEYKEWKEKRSSASEGVGDTLEKVFKASGVADVVKFIAGEDCGCDERKEKLNKVLPFNNPECFTEDEYVYLTGVFKSNVTKVNFAARADMIKIYNRVFRKKQQNTSCGSCIRRVYNDLKRYYDKYNE
jgi:hypothetical protein